MQFNRYIIGYSSVTYASFMGYNYLDYKDSLRRYNDEYCRITPDQNYKRTYIQKDINVYSNFVEALIFPISLPKRILPYLN